MSRATILTGSLWFCLLSSLSIAENVSKPSEPVIEALEVLPAVPVLQKTNTEVPNSKAKSPVTSNDARAAYWRSQGYELAWSDTPGESDYGKTIKQYFSSESNFANGEPISSGTGGTGEDLGQTVSFEEFDGRPVLKAFTPAGVVQTLYVKGAQLGQDNTHSKLVASQMVYVSAENPVTSNGRSGAYIGHGHHWGSRPGVTVYPAGSRNSLDGWSVRAPLGGNNAHMIYYYPASPPSSAAGVTKISNLQPLTGQWMLMELEIVSNSPASKSNGSITLYRNGEVIAQENDIQLRVTDDTYPKGYGIFIRHNNGAAADEVIYLYDFKMYTKP